MEAHQLERRATCYYRNSFGGGGYYGECSTWYTWGRWVLAGACVFVFLMLSLCCLCMARRRRKRGIKPYYGTGWMAPQGGKYGNQQQPYNGAYNNNHQMYNYNQGGQAGYQQPYAGQQQQDYYGGQQYGVQSPPATYQQNTYAPPPGPPPNK